MTEKTPEKMDPESVAHQFVHVEGDEKPQPVSRISPEEQHRRSLQRRFKRLRGYKPIERNIDKLTQMVEAAERAANMGSCTY